MYKIWEKLLEDMRWFFFEFWRKFGKDFEQFWRDFDKTSQKLGNMRKIWAEFKKNFEKIYYLHFWEILKKF